MVLKYIKYFLKCVSDSNALSLVYPSQEHTSGHVFIKVFSE